MRAVLDVNVLISAVLSPTGAPARLLAPWRDGAFELVVSPALLDELERALAYPKLRERIPPEDAGAYVALLRQLGDLRDDPSDPPPAIPRDPDDAYLVALAAAARAVLVTGDAGLLALAPDLPVFAPAAFLAQLADPT